MKITSELLKKHHQGLCTPEQEAEIKAWLQGQQNEYIPDYLSADEWNPAGERIWKNISSSQNTNDKTVLGKNRKVTFWLSGIAASLLFIAGFWIILSSEKLHGINEVVYQTVKTAKGKKMKFYLPDSSLVFLNAGSEIRFPKQFEDSARRVTLIGEGYFKITKDAKRPFTIQSGQTQVRVLGTEFNLKSYKNENTILTVKEGKVLFGKNQSGQQLIVTAHQSAQFKTADQSLKRKNVYSEGELSWKDNQLEFSAMPLSEIALILERWYDIHIEIKTPQIAARKFSGSYSNPSLETILLDMSMLMKFNYKLTGDKLVIR